MRTARRLESLRGYAFAELDRLRDERRGAGADPIDFGVGDPTDPTPDVVVRAAAAGLERHRRAGYPSYVGSPALREAAAAWIERRHGVRLDPRTEVTVSAGSKEAVFHLPLAFVDPGDVVLVPSPGYPPYARGTRCAGGEPRAYAVEASGPVLPDLDALEPGLAARLRVVWITQPHVPTGRAADRVSLARLLAQAREREVLVCSDEAYGELWTSAPPPGLLEAGRHGLLVFQSLSKRAAMTGYRVGFVAGDARAVGALRLVKTNVDSGVPRFVEDAAVAALGDEDAPAVAREAYAARAAALVPALRALGCRLERPEAGFYLWARVPAGHDGVSFARALLASPAALVVMPGEWLADPVPGRAGTPGDAHVRLALVPDLERCREAAARLRRWAPTFCEQGA